MIFKKSQNILTILIDSANLTLCGWIVCNDKLTFCAFYQHKLEHEIINLRIFNPTKIENIIDSFLYENKIDEAKVYISFDATLAEEFICTETEYALIFQYQLMFIKLKLNLVKISTDLEKDPTGNEFKSNIANSINFDFEKYITNNSAIKDLDKLTLIKSAALFIECPVRPERTK